MLNFRKAEKKMVPIYFPVEFLKAIDRQAENELLSRSAWLRRAAARCLHEGAEGLGAT